MGWLVQPHRPHIRIRMFHSHAPWRYYSPRWVWYRILQCSNIGKISRSKILILSLYDSHSTNEILICPDNTRRKRIVRREYLVLKSSSPSPLPPHLQNSKILPCCIVGRRLSDRQLLYHQSMPVNFCIQPNWSTMETMAATLCQL